ncbi:tetratricopeptide repeat protein [Planctomyces sp. SH-PL14]|uniref:tetratricopeptide repeat protein n=1 Tax=Planctomyces sp. SH-PL14 TaxID=1632864 RepID=UPI00078B5BCA|nr:tetratricopeptide repeat protein [Planctomyces sp. SH-PL14]AMV18607.1 Tetratricopeptide repeat protein [Planctomyces sp. SH-PL14]
MSERSREFLLSAAALVVLAIAAHAPALRCGYIWDDDAYLTKNELVQSPDGLGRIWFDRHATPQYYPLVYTTFWLEHRLWGLHPAGFHLMNILLHAGSVVLLYALLRRWSPAAAVVGVAFWGTALFAVHPIHVESVAWVTERKNVLSGLFYLSAFLVYWDWREGRTGERSSSAAHYTLALGLFVLALLSKSITATLPAAILVAVWWKDGKVTARDVIPLLPHFVLGIAGGLHTAWLERVHVFAQTGDLQWTLARRLATAGAVPWFYLGKILFPWPLSFFYPRWTLDGSRAADWIPLAGTIALLGLLVIPARRGVRWPLALTFFFGGTLFPVLGLLPVYPMRFSVVADHFVYLASLGPLTAAGVALAALGSRSPLLGRACGTAVCLLLIGLTWFQIEDYRSITTLWRRTLAKNPDCYLCVNDLAQERTSLAEQEAEYRKVTRMAPRFELGWSNLAQSLEKQERMDEALEAYREAIRVEPHYSLVYARVAQILEDRGDLSGALENARMAMRHRPGPGEYSNLGRLLAMTGDLDEAGRQIDRGLKLDPDHVDSLINRATILAMRGDLRGAETDLRRAWAVAPGDARVRAGLERLGVGPAGPR